MSKENIREMKAMWQSIDLEAKLKDQVNNRITKLGKEISKIGQELEKVWPEEREKLIKEKGRFQEKLEHEQLKQVALQREIEPRLQRLKRLITDLIKRPDSKIPLRGRLWLLFKLEGFRIAAVIITVTMLFSTIGLSISNSLRGDGGGGGPTPSPGPCLNPLLQIKLKKD